jgi:phosphatidylethanolamine/phosphatidyl-N-methylethanolamine N-methyltransferase
MRFRGGDRLFRAEAWADFHHVGAVAPSGRVLAGALAAAVPSPAAGPRRILEVGAGTGAVTTALVARLGPADELVVVERSPAFAARLRGLAREYEPLGLLGARYRVVCADVADFRAPAGFAAVVSSLPFNNFAAADVARLLGHLRGLLEPAGRLAFFEYLWVRSLRGTVSGRDERRRLRDVGAVINATLRATAGTSRIVWWNLPPAVVHVLRPAAGGASEPDEAAEETAAP